MINKIKNIKLPILYKDGRQLQVVKNGYLVGSYDPVYNLKIEKDILIIAGEKYTYEHKLKEFDDIVVEEFELDDNGDRIYEGEYFTYYKRLNK